MKRTLASMLARINHRTRGEIYQQTLAQVEQQGGDLQVINNPSSFGTLLKVYQRFINDADLRGLPTFLIEVDRMLQDFGGQPMAPEVDEEGEEEGDEATEGGPKAKAPPAKKPVTKAQ